MPGLKTMDFFKNVMAMLDSRTRQLKKQAEADEGLRGVAAMCPATVAMFLLEERKLGQREAALMEDMPVRQKAIHSMRMLHEWDQRYAKMAHLLGLPSQQRCAALQTLTLDVALQTKSD